jgi:hypothetical protein
LLSRKSSGKYYGIIDHEDRASEPPVWTIMPPPRMMAPGILRTPACGIPG